MTILFDELDNEFENYEDEDFFLENEFDNSYENKHYVLTGIIQTWDRKGEAHYPKVFNSIFEAIIKARNFGQTYIKITEEQYGKLCIEVSHHDGTNILEIKEVTKVGEEMLNNYKEVIDLIKRKGALKNVKFTKRYR